MANNTLNYQVNFSTNLDSLQSQIKKLAAEMTKLKPDNGSKFTGLVSNLDKSFDRLREKMSKPITSSKGFSAIESEVASITSEFETLMGEYTKLSSLTRSQKLKLLPDDIAQQLTNASRLLKDFERELSHIDKAKPSTAGATKKLSTAEAKLADYESKIAEKQNKKGSSAQKEKVALLDQQIAALKKLKETQEAYDKASALGTKADKRKRLMLEDGTEYSLPGAKGVVKKIVGADAAKLDSAGLQAQIAQLEQTKNEVIAAAESASAQDAAELEKYQKVAADTRIEIENLKKSIAEQEKTAKSQKTDQKNTAFTKLYDNLKKLGVNLDDIDPKLGYTEEGFATLKQKVSELTDKQLESLNSQIAQTGTTASAASNDINKLGEETKQAGEDVDGFNNRAEKLGEIKSYAQQFIGFTGAINIARNAIRKATTSIKELDATMAEMAVVTDESIGGYWDKLPTYTRRANELGVSINSVYQSDMLLYQQGLKTNQVVEISTEALKMARIAGLDAEEATNRLTSAIRGFGMELDQASAQRVSDVYSELAA